jgi:hypothetical protein
VQEAVRPSRSLDVRVRTIGDRLFIARGNQVFELQDVAEGVWSRSDGTRTVAEIAVEITNEYDVSYDQAFEDVTAFISHLGELSFVEFV